ncbi:MAG: helix-hairpin-helix domain-containing protein [Chthoniobacterales bacterium]
MIAQTIARFFFLGICLSVCAGSTDDHRWTVLRDCRLIANPSNDGDSFHVSAGGKEYIFRLYLVDAPEAGTVDPSRLLEQAKYFGITAAQVIDVADEARRFTAEKLSAPFTVLTRLSDAMGRSRTERFYAFVETKEGDLGEQLVRNGLARIHGSKITPPSVESMSREQEHLHQLEDAARIEKIGGWANGDPKRISQRAENPAPPINRFQVPENEIAPGTEPTKDQPPTNLDVNRATKAELEALPGVGPVMAERIIAARPFQSADELRRVPGIGDKKYAELRRYFQ